MADKDRIPRPGEIYNHFKNKPYQIITVATHSETGESMVVYQALYGDFKTYVRPLSMFLSEVDNEKYPDARQKNRFELSTDENKIEEVSEKNLNNCEKSASKENSINNPVASEVKEKCADKPENSVNAILLKFLDASSYNKKLEIVSSNTRNLNDRLVNDMAVSLDCTIEDGPIDQRIHELIFCLQAMCRFEDRRLR